MRIKIFVPNEYGRIELTKEELEKLLNESYQQGWNDKPNYYYNQPYYTLYSNTANTSCSASSTTINDFVATTDNTIKSTAESEVNDTFEKYNAKVNCGYEHGHDSSCYMNSLNPGADLWIYEKSDILKIRK